MKGKNQEMYDVVCKNEFSQQSSGLRTTQLFTLAEPDIYVNTSLICTFQEEEEEQNMKVEGRRECAS